LDEPTVTPSPVSGIHGPSGFKGIALFTPGGDCVYCIDTEKRSYWHIDLCAVLQQRLGLPEPPYFLLPCFTATIDSWLDPTTHTWITLAEAYPRVIRYETLLNVLFQVENVCWQPNYSDAEHCSPAIIEAAQTQFPSLWKSHDLVVQVKNAQTASPSSPQPAEVPLPQTYVFMLFVRELETPGARQMLEGLHHALDSVLMQPYTLEVVDVTSRPELAETYQITAVPTLLQASPQPTRRVVGHALTQNTLAQLFG